MSVEFAIQNLPCIAGCHGTMQFFPQIENFLTLGRREAYNTQEINKTYIVQEDRSTSLKNSYKWVMWLEQILKTSEYYSKKEPDGLTPKSTLLTTSPTP